MPKITNPNYRKFLDKGLIDLISYDTMKKIINKVNGINNLYQDEGRALMITLYYTGARPVEILNMKAKQIYRKKSYVAIELQAVKRGKNRTMLIPFRSRLIKQLYKYAATIFNDMFLFHHYKSKTRKQYYNKQGDLIKYLDISDKLRYHVKKWTKTIIPDSITPYFFRHNRFSKLAEQGLTPQDIQFYKGSKSVKSVEPYLHLSTQKAEKIAKFIK